MYFGCPNSTSLKLKQLAIFVSRIRGLLVSLTISSAAIFCFLALTVSPGQSQAQGIGPTNNGPGLLVDGVPTNCCSEVYGAGFELGALRSIAHFVIVNYVDVARVRLARLSATIENARSVCNKICPAWAGWHYQPDIKAAAERISPDPESRRGTMGWASGKPRSWGEGLKQCEIWEGTHPTQWTRLSSCAEIYFVIGYSLGNAWHNFELASQGVTNCIAHRPTGTTTDQLGPHNPRVYGMTSLRNAIKRIKDLRELSTKLETETQANYCVHLWDKRLGILPSLQEVILQPVRFSDAEIAARILAADTAIKQMFWRGRPDLKLWPCPGSDECDDSLFGECFTFE